MADVCIGMVLSGNQAIAREAVECILGQSGAELEVFLVESHDNQSFPALPDSRVRWLKRPRLPNQMQLLELLANESNAPFLLCLNPNQHLLPNGLATLLADMRDDESIEMAYALQFPADKSGHVSRAAYHLQWDRALKLQGFDATRVQDFLAMEFLPDTIRVYRRQALRTKVLCRPEPYSTFGFIWSVHCLLKTKLKPEPVCISKGKLPSPVSNHTDLPDFLRRVTALLRYGTHLHTGFSRREVLLRALWLSCLNSPVADAGNRGMAMIRRWQIRSGLSKRCYWFFVRLFSRLSPPGPRTARTAATNAQKRIGYYIWQYPVRSQTFVQREVAALLKAGQDVVVIPEIEPEHDFITELKPLLVESVIRRGSLTGVTHASLEWKVIRRSPLRYIGLKLFILGTNYHPKKSRRFDKEQFKTALRIAALAEERGIDHLHSPWADNCAFVALIAARLLRIPCSLQARAHDIHRRDYRFGLPKKLLNADFIITNTRYNVSQIQALVGDDHAGKIKLIYNGLNIRQFQPARVRRPDDDELRLLCVARLIEQKGLIYLLQACRRLLDSGLKVRCDIIGGFEAGSINYYIKLKRLHQVLGLENTVHFAGSLPFEEVLAYYQKADVFVLPCVIAQDGSRDIIPNAVLEAMAMQLPVVSTSITGLPEMIDDGRSGFLVPPHDVEALVASINALAQSTTRRSEFGSAARRRVELRFYSDINVAQYQLLFSGPGNPAG